jgi:hypothetical protein
MILPMILSHRGLPPPETCSCARELAGGGVGQNVRERVNFPSLVVTFLVRSKPRQIQAPDRLL